MKDLQRPFHVCARVAPASIRIKGLRSPFPLSVGSPRSHGSAASTRSTAPGRVPRIDPVLTWLAARDPGWSVLRRSLRVALVACAGFYTCRYLVHSPTMATYALFG